MTTIHLFRFKTSDPTSTFGVIRFPSGRRAVTVEPPWLDNRTDVSCIVPGDHHCELTWSPRFKKKLYHIEAEGRVGCRFHVANFASELEGCIAMGQKIARFHGAAFGVTNSATTLRAFMKEMNGAEFNLRIIDMSIMQRLAV